MATPELRKAIRELNAKDISILKALNSPPKCVKDVVLCLLYLNPTGNEYMYLQTPHLEPDWSVMRQMLGQPKLLKQLQMYKYKENMTIEMYYRIACVLRSHEPILNVETIKKACISAVGIFNFIIALMKYYSDKNDVFAAESFSTFKTEYQLECEMNRKYTEAEINAFETRLLELEQKNKTLEVQEEDPQNDKTN